MLYRLSDLHLDSLARVTQSFALQPNNGGHTTTSTLHRPSQRTERKLSSPCVSPAVTVGVALMTGEVGDSTRVAGSPIPAD